MVRLVLVFVLTASAVVLSSSPAQAQAPYEEAVIDVGNVGLTVTNAGFVGNANVRSNPGGPPSFEYPLGSGVEHLFEAGLWVGGIRTTDGTVQVRTAAVTAGSGYQPGLAGYEMAPLTPLRQRSTLPSSVFFSTQAVSQQDVIATFADYLDFLPGTNIEMPDPGGALGLEITQRNYAWSFPFAESFVISEFDIVNVSDAPIDSVYVGMWHDLVVRNVNTTTDAGGAFFSAGGYGFLDSLQTSYAFNAGGVEEGLNTYGSIAVLGAEWPTADGDRRFFHPSVADEYEEDGLPRPQVTPHWWQFSGTAGDPVLERPSNDQERYNRMALPYPNPAVYEACDGPNDLDCGDDDPALNAYEQARQEWYEQLRTDGVLRQGNWIGLTPLGPFPYLESGDTLTVAFAWVAALKPDAFQGLGGRPIDTEASRAFLRNNVEWARRTYAGEDNDYDGELDPGEDINNNGVLDRYLIPEPPQAPQVRVAFEQSRDERGRAQSQAVLYWDLTAELSRDPVTGEQDFEGYRIYSSDAGDDRLGNILNNATEVAEYDRPGNRTGDNVGFEPIRIREGEVTDPNATVATDEDGRTYVTFPGDETRYYYRYVTRDLLAGWQYLFSVTAFDEGDVGAGLESFETGPALNAVRVFPGTPAAGEGEERGEVGVYPNPYRLRAAWDGDGSRSRRLNFYNLPARAEVRIYTFAGELLATLDHDESYAGTNAGWYQQFGGNPDNRRIAGGEHSWDVLSENDLNIASGLYFFTVEDLDTGDVERGKFVIIK